MKFCPECGINVEGMKFCPECGYKLTESNPTEHNIDEENNQEYFEPLIDIHPLVGWKPTYKIGKFKFDDLTKTFMIGGFLSTEIYQYCDIKDYEIIENNSVIGKSGGFGVGRAITGGLLFGGIGAVVGGVTKKGKTESVIESLKIKIIMDNPQYPLLFVDVAKNIKANTFLAKTARNETEQIITALERIMMSGIAESINQSQLNIKLEERKTEIQAAETRQAETQKAIEEKAEKNKRLKELKEAFKNGEISKDEYKDRKKNL